MASSLHSGSRRFRWVVPALLFGAAALLGGCVAYPAGYYGYDNNYGYGYGYGYAPAPAYNYAPGPYVAFGVGGDGGWGDRGWGDHDWHGHGWGGQGWDHH